MGTHSSVELEGEQRPWTGVGALISHWASHDADLTAKLITAPGEVTPDSVQLNGLAVLVRHGNSCLSLKPFLPQRH